MAKVLNLLRLAVAPILHGGNRWTRQAERMQEPLYWLAHNRFKQLRFKLLRALFHHQHRLAQGRTATAVARQVLRAVFWPSLFAAACVFALLTLDGLLSQIIIQTVWPAWDLLLPDSIAVPIETWAAQWDAEISDAAPPTESRSALLVTGAQVTGTFLGLYFTAVSVVASTAYRDSPPELRAILLEDQAGNLYLRLVAFTGAACLFGLGFGNLGYEIGPLTSIVLGGLSAISVLSFVILGKMVFDFFSPQAVTDALARDFVSVVEKAASSDWYSRDRSFQAHYYRIASRKLDAWEQVVAVTLDARQSTIALREIGKRSVNVMRWYSRAKRPIPPESHWFERKLHHPSYFTAGSTELDLALKVGSMNPTEEPEPLWVEKRFQDFVERAVRNLAQQGEARAAIEVLTALNQWFANSAYQLQLDEIKIGFATGDRLVDVIHKLPEEPTKDSSKKIYRIALTDALIQALPNCVGSLNRRLQGFDSTKWLQASTEVVRGSGSTREFPPRVRKNIQFFRQALAFERDVEGESKTPDWFVHHHLARVLSADLIAMLEFLLSRAETDLPRQIKALRDEDRAEAAVSVVERGLETTFKLEAASSKAATVLAALSERRTNAGGDEWPQVEVSTWKGRVRRLRRDLLVSLVPLVPRLPTAPPSGDLPDSFGFAFTTLSDAAIEALLERDEDFFERTYPLLVVSALAAHDRVRTELAESPVESILLYSADVLLDVLEIAGYAYVWAFAVGDENYWSVVTDAWDRILTAEHDSDRLVQLIMAQEDYHEGQFTISPRSLIRTQWRMQVSRFLADQGFDTGDMFRESTQPAAIPIDPTVTAYLRSMDLGQDARDLFLSYLLNHVDEADVVVPRGVRELRESAQRLASNRGEGRTEGLPGIPGLF